MAYGGMRGGGIPIGQRAQGAVTTSQPDPGAAPGRASLPLHCWVVTAEAGSRARLPGVLLEWRHDHSGWLGLVVFAVPDDAGTPTVVTRLVPADQLSPA